MSDSSEVQSSAPAAAEPTEAQAETLDSQASAPDAEAQPQTPAEAKAEEKKVVAELKRKLKLKVDGREFEEEVDLGNEEYLREQLQLAKVARKRMSEYSSLEKQVDMLFDKLKDPKALREVLTHPDIGHDLKKLAAEIIEEEIENSKKTPEQLRAEKAEAELKRIMDEREKEKQEARQREIQMLEEKAFEQYNASMDRAIQKANLPDSPYVVRKLADYMMEAVRNGIDVSPEDVIGLVNDDITRDIQELFKVAPVELIEKLVGKDKLKEVRKKSIAAAKDPAIAAAISGKKIPDVAKASEEPKPSEKKTIKQLFGV